MLFFLLVSSLLLMVIEPPSRCLGSCATAFRYLYARLHYFYCKLLMWEYFSVVNFFVLLHFTGMFVLAGCRDRCPSLVSTPWPKCYFVCAVTPITSQPAASLIGNNWCVFFPFELFWRFVYLFRYSLSVSVVILFCYFILVVSPSLIPHCRAPWVSFRCWWVFTCGIYQDPSESVRPAMGYHCSALWFLL